LCVYQILTSKSLFNPVLILTGSIIKVSSHHFESPDAPRFSCAQPSCQPSFPQPTGSSAKPKNKQSSTKRFLLYLHFKLTNGGLAIRRLIQPPSVSCLSLLYPFNHRIMRLGNFLFLISFSLKFITQLEIVLINCYPI